MPGLAAAGACRRVISLCVRNQPGVLVRVALVFARRGVNIDRLSVREGEDPAFSRMTICAAGGQADLRLIYGQLNRLVDVVHLAEQDEEQVARTGQPPLAPAEAAVVPPTQ